MSDMRCEWVIGYFQGEFAKHVLAQAGAGVGYFILEDGGTKGKPEVAAAFRRPIDGVLPDHLQRVTDPYKIEDYETLRRQRQGLHDEAREVSHE